VQTIVALVWDVLHAQVELHLPHIPQTRVWEILAIANNQPHHQMA